MDEIEIKFRLEGAAAHDRLRARLRALGATGGAREHEDNVLFDDAADRLRTTHQVLRVRVLDGGPRCRLTYKGPARYTGAIKQREEHEVEVADATVLQAVLTGLGYQPALHYAKLRETWHLDGAEVALDVLEFGWYCEIEGTPAAIDRLVAALELDRAAAERAGYPDLAARERPAASPAPPGADR